MALRESGYLAVELGSAEAGREPTRLIAVTVTPDRAPSVYAWNGRAATCCCRRSNQVVEIDAAASDDIALGALALRYTKVSGSGEQFEFVEGELPLAVTRESAQNWRAHGRIPVAALGLEPGDSLVYRLTARDERPGTAGRRVIRHVLRRDRRTGTGGARRIRNAAGPGTLRPEPADDRRQAATAAGARETSEPPALDDETGALAAEQRAVRGNFVFLMGGHVEDEEEEAEHSNEIQEGRLENTARREIWRAVSHMTVVEQALAGHDTGARADGGRESRRGAAARLHEESLHPADAAVTPPDRSLAPSVG